MTFTWSRLSKAQRKARSRAGLIWLLHEGGLSYWHIGQMFRISPSRAQFLAKRIERIVGEVCGNEQDPPPTAW